MEHYWCWLCSHRTLYRPHLKLLLDYFGTPRELFETSEKEIKTCRHLNQKQQEELLQSRRAWNSEKKYHEWKKSGIRFISSEHSEYPASLLDMIDYPYGLFIKGKLPRPEVFSVAMVGARKCTVYGRQAAQAIAEKLACNGVQIISGMAAGIDGYSQHAALEAGGASFGVLGCGVDVCYPASNRRLYEALLEKGGVISEFCPGREPLAHHFPIRNRIISGLSAAVIVVEAKEHSGSLITADQALEQSRDVLAVPGRMYDGLSSGCNWLIEQGAGVILSPDQLLETFNLRSKKSGKLKKSEISLETKEKLVYSCVDFQPNSLDEIAGKAPLSVQEVMSVLTALVLKGYIEEPMKNYYIKTDWCKTP